MDQLVELTAILLISTLVFGPSMVQRCTGRASRTPVQAPTKVDQVAIGIMVLGVAVVFGFILVLASW